MGRVLYGLFFLGILLAMMAKLSLAAAICNGYTCQNGEICSSSNGDCCMPDDTCGRYLCSNTGCWDSCSGNYIPGEIDCCVADNSCASSTCDTDTCSDSCGNSYTGTIDCAACDGTCADQTCLGQYCWDQCGNRYDGTRDCSGGSGSCTCPSSSSLACGVHDTSGCGGTCDVLGMFCAVAGTSCTDIGGGSYFCTMGGGGGSAPAGVCNDISLCPDPSIIYCGQTPPECNGGSAKAATHTCLQQALLGHQKEQ